MLICLKITVKCWLTTLHEHCGLSYSCKHSSTGSRSHHRDKDQLFGCLRRKKKLQWHLLTLFYVC